MFRKYIKYVVINYNIFVSASPVTYSIVEGNTYNAFLIEPKTGKIRVNSQLDYENITSVSSYLYGFKIHIILNNTFNRHKIIRLVKYQKLKDYYVLQ